MRPTCTFCARKHLAQASILMNEAAMGYPEHLWLAIGHMAEASEELIATYPEMANRIRDHRKGLEQGGVVPFMDLIKAVGELGSTGVMRSTGGVPTGDMITAGTKFAEPTEGALKMLGEFPPAPGGLRVGSTIPAPVPTPAPCLTCGDKGALNTLVAKLATEKPKPRLMILTTLGDFNPAYSLVSVILEQAHAAVMAGYRVFLLVHRGCSMDKCPPLPPEIDVLSIVPAAPWRDDVIDVPSAIMFVDAMKAWFEPLKPEAIITHDLLFQAAFVTFAKAIHQFPADGPIHWYHMAHSSVGERPDVLDPELTLQGSSNAEARARWYRCTLPPGHHLIALNYADVPYLRRYYRTNADGSGALVSLPEDRIHVLRNSKDVRPFLRMSQRASMLTTRFQLHTADVTMVYPISLDRAREKGVDKVLEVFGALKRLGLTVRLLLITAHANDPKHSPSLIEWIKEHAKANYLTVGEEVILTCDVLPETNGFGLPADDVRALWMVSNLFVFPTVSEAGSLVLMEAASAGCHLVLNGSLQCLADYIPRDMARWVRWGSSKEPAADVGDLSTLAQQIWSDLQADKSMALRRRMMEQHSLEAYGAALRDILDPGVEVVHEAPSAKTLRDLVEGKAPAQPSPVVHKFKVKDSVVIERMTPATAHYGLAGKQAIVLELEERDGEPWYYLSCDGALGSLPETCLKAL